MKIFQGMLLENRKPAVGKTMAAWWVWLVAALGIAVIITYWYWAPIREGAGFLYQVLTDRQLVSDYVASFGAAAPLVFMGVQVAQVVMAPIPGEATGFIGGYLFGAFAGCFYSSIALTIGSWLNFVIGRFVGKRWVRRIIPREKLDRYDHLMRHQGMLVVFLLFLFPGFPKDYLCLFLGISTMPMRVFLLMTMVGRIPGTLMLSLQGALVFEKNYLIFCLLLALNAIAIYYGYRYRESLYRWVENINKEPPADIEDEQH